MSEPSEPAPLPSRRALRAAEREAEKQATGQSGAGLPESSTEQVPSRASSAEAHKAPLTGAIPAVPAARARSVPAIPRPTSPLTELPKGAFAMAPVAPIGEPTLALPPKAESPVSEPGAVQTTTAPASRAGRDLPAAIGVGLLLLVAVLVGLLLYPPAFLAMVVLAAALGVWELSRGLLQRDVRVPLVPMMVGVLAMPVAAYYAGAEGLLFALSACALAILIWRTLDPVPGAGQSIFAGIFVLAWVPFLISFALLVLRDPNNLASLFEFRNWTAALERCGSPPCCSWWWPMTPSATWSGRFSGNIRWLPRSARKSLGKALPDPCSERR